VTGTRWLTKQPEFHNIDKLNKVLNLLEDSNVWKHISYNQQKTGKTLITFGKEIGANDIAIATTDINAKDTKHQLSIVGPTRMDYAEVKGLLEFIKEQIEHFNK
jgi:heat-inducible transcriptional repressor